MKSDPFYFEIKDMITQFVAAFDGVTIKRYNKTRDIQDRLQVRYVYSPKQRIIHDIINKAKHITLPVIAVNITGISRDPKRVFNKLDSSYYLMTTQHNLTGDVGQEDNIPQPVPVNISINMSILTKFQSDMDQILSNFVPYNNPYVVISWKVPSSFATVPQEIRSEVLWNDTISLTYPTELTPDSPYRVSADTQFTIKGWLFRKETSPVKTIFTIDTTVYAISSVDGMPDISSAAELANYNSLFLDAPPFLIATGAIPNGVAGIP
tara:strand:+ start:1314 stop:2108 length:795 start_codon:yes stop_codon:yes gene_type:complete